MTITLTAFESSPDRGRGLARDMRLRWALEEVGQPYRVRLLSFAEMKTAEHLAIQPFGQIPTYEEAGITLFETGAILLHIAQKHPGLLPGDEARRARAISWLFAALNSVEPVIVELESAILLERQESWFDKRRPLLEQRIRTRLAQLSQALGDRAWLEGEFSAGDLMMVTVLRRPAASPLLAEYSNLADYVARGEARPAFARAFADQLAVFEASKAKG